MLLVLTNFDDNIYKISQRNFIFLLIQNQTLNLIPVNSSQINFVYKEVLVILCQSDQSSQNVTIDFSLILHVKYMFCTKNL